MRVVLLLILIFFPALSMAAGVFDVPSTDKSMQYLGMVFGPVAGLPINSDTNNTLFSQVVYVFNNVVFALSIVIISYTTVIGSLNTAQEGQVLGKKWHPILLPARAALGLYLLIPVSGNGYNWIQVTVMWFIVQGVGAANAIWTQAVTQHAQDGSIHTDTVVNPKAFESVFSIFESVVCMEKINNDAQAMAILKEPISYYRHLDKIEFGRPSMIDVEKPLCGAITIPTLGTSIMKTGLDQSTEDRKAIIANAITFIAGTLQGAATDAINGGSSSFANTFSQCSSILSSTALNLATTFQSLDTVTQDAIKNGWIHAGSYYLVLTTGNGSGGKKDLTLNNSGMDATKLNTLLGSEKSGQLQAAITAAVVAYQAYVTNAVDTSSNSGELGKLKFDQPSGVGSQAGSIVGLILGGLMETVVQAVNDSMSSGGAFHDPIISMRDFGASLSIAAESTFWGALVAVLLAWAATSIASCINSVGHAMDYTLQIVVPVAILIISLCWVSGITLCLYVPMIPYLVFTFSALSWIILVIEAMLGAPLIALTLIVPSEEEIGKAGHAIVILLGLFLRPALMILGFVLAIKLLMVAIQMLNFGFWSTLMDSTGGANGMGFFALIAVILMYTSIAIGLVHEAFSLIYMIPNQALRWMGAGGEGDDAGGKAKELKGSVEKGAGMGAGMMKSGLSSAQKKQHGADKAANKKGGGMKL